MRDLLAAFQTALGLDGSEKFVALLEIHTDPVIYRGRGRTVTFLGTQYVADAFNFGELRQSADLDTPTLDLTLQNVRDPVTDAQNHWSTYLASNDLDGVEVRIRVVNTDHLTDATAQIAEVAWTISGVSRLTRQTLTLQLGTPHNSNVHRFPGPPLGSDRCWWQALGLYKRAPCNSESAEPDCLGRVADCEKRFPNQPIRFGPSYPFMGAGRGA